MVKRSKNPAEQPWSKPHDTRWHGSLRNRHIKNPAGQPWDATVDLDVQIESGYQRGARGQAEVDRVRMEDFDIAEVVIEENDEAGARCLVYLSARLMVRADVEIEPEQIGEDDWDPGHRGIHDLVVSADMAATIVAKVAPDGSVELSGAGLDGEKVFITWDEIERQID